MTSKLPVVLMLATMCILATAQASSGAQSLALSLNPADGNSYGSDVYIVALNNGAVVTSGSWTLSYEMFLPAGLPGEVHMFISQAAMTDFKQGAWLLAKEADGNVLQYSFGADTAPLVYDQWAEGKFDINLDADTVTAYYDGAAFHTGVWEAEDTPTPAIGGLNFWIQGGNNTTGLIGTAYFDNFALVPSGGQAVWSDDFESYTPGNVDGQGPWIDFGGTLTTDVTPEPTTLALLGLGGLLLRRRRKA